MKHEERLKQVELILSDVDGVFTDGGIIFDNQGIETKRFHVRDGLAVKLWRQAGYQFGLISSRSSQIVRNRSAELGIDLVRQGVPEKLPVAQEIITSLKLQPEQVCYIGDDLPDLPVIQYVGVGVAVADAAAELRTAALLTTKAPGGEGAIRELVETLLKAKQRWDEVVRKHLA
ncbi:KdsC family phosphatase [Lignipirellula cremea]|uniref:3-deoxy-D-manno-octulosonate 8-phosphate phosphatase KdsC n=1 Tax=Lignipirellula cremea TaxID=2528010 RepID=A0A518DSV8_9BACT|nr:HAD hydrolase family protein [Lignipirellula cremea]QDU94914.1 3-deoxy-D-manno-octulosonate 8-phosphate phosphatase KdsC [Lignipirellula cremea]